jgi:hypothetical protein
MNTLQDANAFGIALSFLTAMGIFALIASWNGYSDTYARRATRQVVVVMVILSLFVMAVIIKMYLHTWHYQYGMNPSPGTLKLAVVIIAAHLLNIGWLACVYQHTRNQQNQLSRMF